MKRFFRKGISFFRKGISFFKSFSLNYGYNSQKREKLWSKKEGNYGITGFYGKGTGAN